MKSYFNQLFLLPALTLAFVATLATTTQTSAGTIKPPTVAITVPKTGAKWSNDVYTVTGTVKAGTAAVSNVLVSVNSGAWSPATLSNATWHVQINLTVGTNTITAYATDTNGIHSVTNTAKVVYVLVSPVSVAIVGSGTLTPNLNNDRLIIGNQYTMKATAATGFAFYFWDVGGFMTNSSTVKFSMVSNLVITANFRDIKVPLITITTPKSGIKYSNDVIFVTGTTSDNVGVVYVGVRINGGGWVPAVGTTNWNTYLPVVAGNNTIEAYAVDAAGNYSKTNLLTFTGVATPGAWAPLSVTNSTITLVPVLPAPGAPHTLCFGPFFTYSDTNSTAPDSGIGSQYVYLPVTTNYSEVQLQFSAPPPLIGYAVDLTLTFTNFNTGYYTNGATGEVGSFSIAAATQLVPASWSGKTYIYTPDGSSTSDTIKFTSASAFQDTVNGTSDIGTYVVVNANRIGAFFELTETGPTSTLKIYTQATFTSASGGFFERIYYENGTQILTDTGTFHQ